MNITELSGVGSESYPLVDAQLRKIIWRNSSGTKAKFGINDIAHIEMDANGDDGKEIGFYFGENKAAKMIANNLILTGHFSGGGYYFKNNISGIHDIIRIKDESDEPRNFIGHNIAANGERGIQIGTKISAMTNDLSLMIGADGTRVVRVTEPAMWRKALGIGNIGQIVAHNWTKNVPNNTITNMGSITLGPGNWWVQCTAHFPYSSSYPNGYRNIYISTTTTGSYEDRFAGSSRIAAVGEHTINTFTTLRRYGATSTRYINVIQNAGTQINNVVVGVAAVRLTNFC